MLRELHSFCEVFQGAILHVSLGARFIYHSNPIQIIHPQNRSACFQGLPLAFLHKDNIAREWILNLLLYQLASHYPS